MSTNPAATSDAAAQTRRLILCAGIPRSGSTWLYNIARLALERHGGGPVHGAWVERYDAHDPSPIHVVKVHEPHDALAERASVVLTSRRDLRDIAASAVRRGWVRGDEHVLRWLDDVIRMHQFWSVRAAHELVYEQMLRDRDGETIQIAAAVGLRIDRHQAAEVREAVDRLEFDGSSDEPFDATSLLHSRHVTDGREGYFAEVLSPELTGRINARFERWLTFHGYMQAERAAPR